jgi:hypothetical protein
MPTQQEELRLTITLVDDASAGLARIGAQWRQLSSGSTASHIESFRRRQSEIGEQMKQLAEAATRGERAMLGFVGRLGLAGFAFAKVTELVGAGLKSLSEFSDSVVDLGNKAKAIGIAPGVLKNIEEEFVRIGGTIAGADQNVARFSEAYAEMGRVGSERRAELIRNAGAYGREMEAGIDRILRQRGQVAQINEVLAQGQIVYNNRLKETHGNIADATKILRDYLATWGIDPTFAIIGHIREWSKEEQALSDQRLKNTTEFHKQMADLHLAWNEWMADIGNSMAGVVTPALQKIVELIKEARGAGAIELPRTGEPEDIVGKYGGRGGAPSGAGAPLPLLTQQGSPRESEDYFNTLKENTRELRKLNDKLGPAGGAPSGIGGGIGGGGTGPAGAAGGGTRGAGGGSPGGGGIGGGGMPSVAGGGATGAAGGAAGGGRTPAAGPGITGDPEFANNIYKKALALSIPEPQARLAAAQAQLESRGGESGLASKYNNLFGIKGSGTAGSTSMPTLEQGPGGMYRTNAKFAAYSSQEDSIKHWWAKVQRQWPEAAKATTLEGAAAGLRTGQQGGYATDRNYVAKVLGIDKERSARTAKAPAAVGEDRRTIDAKRVKTHKVEASGKLDVNISPGQDYTLGSKGKLFKPTEPERQSQMVPAQSGPIGAAA